VTCDNVHHNFTWFQWTDGASQDVQGVRAPIETRKDGSLCDPSVNPGTNDSSWIMIQQFNSADNVVQIGYYRYWKNGTSTLCKFWAKHGGVAQPYDCGNLSDNFFTWFTIHPTSDGAHYVIADCGNGGDYIGCTTESSNQAVYSNPVGDVAQEEWWGCGLHIFGASTNKQQVGASGSFVQGEGTGLNWSARTWNSQPDNCGNGTWGTAYNHTQDNNGQIMYFWDDRNNS